MSGIATYSTLLTLDMANVAIRCCRKMLLEARYNVCDKLVQDHSSREIEEATSVLKSNVREAVRLLDDVVLKLHNTREPIVAELNLRDKMALGVPVFNGEAHS